MSTLADFYANSTDGEWVICCFLVTIVALAFASWLSE